MTNADANGGQFQQITELDRLIHEPARLLIVAYLSVAKSADFLFLMRETGLTRGNLSSHMSKLEEAGYVAVQKDFVDRKPRTMLRLTDEGRAAFHEYRQRLQQVLDSLPE